MLFDADHDLDILSMNGDSDVPRPWTLAVQIPATLVQAIAILATIFRLLYRCHLSRFSWEDTWATLALICDIGCLASIWMQAAPYIPYTIPSINLKSNWLLSLAITSVVWFARMSILSSVVRIANPPPKLRFIAYCIGAMFLTMQAGLLAQKIFICIKVSCRFQTTVAIAQLATDVVSDTILVVVSVRFLRDVRLHRDRRILVISAFSATILITGVTILHSVLLFEEPTDTTLIIGHVKAALALFVCNALVLVMLVYRLCQKSCLDPEHSMAQGSVAGSNVAQFTSVINLPSKLSSGVLSATPGVQSREDAAYTNTPTSDTSTRLELDPSYSGKAAAFKVV